MQEDIDSIVGSRSSEEWSYDTDLGRLWNTMLGATINETLRLMPPLIDFPKIVRGAPQPLTFDGKTVSVPTSTMIHVSTVGVQRNPRYWPSSPSKLSNKTHDLDDWVPDAGSPQPRKQRRNRAPPILEARIVRTQPPSILAMAFSYYQKEYLSPSLKVLGLVLEDAFLRLRSRPY